MLRQNTLNVVANAKNMTENNNNRKIPQWLKNLQENSWELELLISGGAIFSLFKFSDFFIDWIGTWIMTTAFPGASMILLIGMIGIKILTLGFVIHLTLRAFWLALVCINYVYPNGINADKIRWKKPYQPKIENGMDLQKQITRVDQQCGTVIYMSIVSAFAIIGISLVFMFLIVIMKIFEQGQDFFSEWIFTVMFICFVIYLVDFICFGPFRKIPYLSYLFFPFFKLFDLISFRQLYQESLWLFNTNVKKIRFIISALVFASFAISLAYLSVHKVLHWPNLFDQREFRWNMADASYNVIGAYIYEGAYMDSWDENSSHRIGIDKKVQRNGLMELFIQYGREYDEYIHQVTKIDSLKSFDKIWSVSVDDSLINGLKWMPTRKLNESIIGITTMVPIEHLSNGLHRLKVYSIKIGQENGEYKEENGYSYTIAFWIDRKK